MSKGLGQKIAIKFTEALSGVSSGPPIISEIPMVLSGHIISAKSEVVAAVNAFDTNIATYWRSDSTYPQWLQVKLATPKIIGKIGIYVGLSRNPNAFEILGSNDGITFTILYSGNINDNTEGWRYYILTQTGLFMYYRLNVLSVYNGRNYICELQLYESSQLEPDYNKNAFVITGHEYQYIGGLLELKHYIIKSVTYHPTIENTILLEVADLNRFNNSIGPINILYDSISGALSGETGKVNNFEVVFTPTELIPVQKPYITDMININTISNSQFIKIIYKPTHTDDIISLTANTIIDFIYVGVINP